MKTRKKTPRMTPLQISLIEPRCGWDARPAERAEDQRAQLAELRTAMQALGRAANAAVIEWIGWHYVAGHTQRAATGDTQFGALFDDCATRMRRVMVQAAPEVHGMQINLLVNWLTNTIEKQKAPNGQSARWRQVLACGRYGAARIWYYETLPLRLFHTAARILVDGPERRPRLLVELRALKDAPPIRLRLLDPALHEGDAGFRERYAVARLIAEGKQSINGSLVYEQRGKLTIALCADRHVEPWNVDEDRPPLVIRADRHHALLVGTADRLEPFGDDKLAELGRLRQRQIALRARIKQKELSGRGKEMREATAEWRDACATFCRQLVARLRPLVEAHGAAQLLYTAGDEECALTLCGTDGKRDIASFPYHTLGRFLQETFGPLGVDVVYTANSRSVKERKARRQRELAADGVNEGDV